MADDEQTAEEDEKLDASYKPDTAALAGDDADFAKALGFGLDGSAGADTQATDEAPAPTDANDGSTAPVESAPSEPAEGRSEVGDETPAAEEPAAPTGDAGNDVESAEGVDEAPLGDADGQEIAVPVGASKETDDAPDDMATGDAGAVEFEDIHPRPASEGMQDTLRARADELLARSDLAAPASLMTADAPTGGRPSRLGIDDGSLARLQGDLSDRDRALAAALADLDATHAELAAARDALQKAGGSETKELEETRVELESVTIERDQLIDQLAATSGQLVQSQRAAEQLEASLRAARGALVPLPEGERALRAEVIGLRGRLEEAGQENVRLASEVASVATELAIATARVEDRQHEIDYHADRARDLEDELAEKDRQLEDAIGRHREALDLATRLQAENTELRSAQAALEETLQARDLEISAREEHLRVTREGLSTRDTQLVDLKELLEQERHRIEALEADLERAEIERGVLVDKVAHRESRIATLTNTLGRIEEAMGQRVPLSSPTEPLLARAEWTRPLPPPPSPRANLSADSAVAGTAPGPTAADPAPTTDPAPIEPTPSEVTADDVAAPSPSVEAEPIPEPSLAVEAEPVAEPSLAVEAEPVAEPSLAVVPDTVAAEPTSSSVAEDAPAETLPADDRPVLREPAKPIEAPCEAPQDPPATLDANEGGDDPATPVRTLTVPPALPPILGHWRDRRLAELEEASADSVADFLARRLIEHLGEPGPEAVYLRSLGGALPDAEARLVTALHDHGAEGIRMEVLDVDEEVAQARRHRIELACLGEVIDVRVGDLEEWSTDAPCHGILLSDALHYQVEPEAVLDRLSPTIERGAVLLFAGRIGAGPVQLSASTLMRLEELWQFLPEPLASQDGLGCPPFRGDDGGTPAATIDPAAALVTRFEALALVGFGHLADLVVGPNRGFALSDEDADARQLLESVVAIDESRGITESLPPRHGVGVFAHGSVGPTDCYGMRWACLDEVFP